jgi:hypothetical protein
MLENSAVHEIAYELLHKFGLVYRPVYSNVI